MNLFKRSRVTLPLLSGLIVFTTLLGCSSNKPVSPNETLANYFEKGVTIDTPQGKQKVPFKVLWIDENAKPLFDKMPLVPIYIPPVNTEYMASSEAAPDDIERMRKFLHEKFTEAALNFSEKKLVVLDTASADSFTMELSLFELEPTNAFINATENILGLFIPGGIVVNTVAQAAGVNAAHEVAKGVIAIGIKFRLNKPETLLVQAYDRRGDRAALIINASDFSRYGNAKESIKSWASDFYKIVLAPPPDGIDAPSSFAVILW